MGPHVHFELIRNGRNCDPLPLFSDAQGLPEWLPSVQSVLWPAGEAPPKAVRCSRRQDHPHPRHDQDDMRLGPEEDSEPLASLSHEGSPGPSLN
jgi:murein DD-endopeptidase MepM/ murein hydrolase activator NlpD